MSRHALTRPRKRATIMSACRVATSVGVEMSTVNMVVHLSMTANTFAPTTKT
jgi:hypothetical protein